MRTRSIAAVLILGAASTAFLAGCSGKPENSPAIRKKFAEYDKMQKSVDDMTTTVASLNDEVKRLTAENSEIRMSIPDVNNGQAAVKSATTTTATDDRASADALTASNVNGIASAGIGSTSLEEATLAGAPVEGPPTIAPAKAEAAPKVEAKEAKPAVKQKEEKAVTEKKAVASGFKEKTASAITPKQVSASKPVAASGRMHGQYHAMQVGETPDSVAAKYGVSKDVIMKANQISPSAKLAVGQKLFIPAAK